MSEGNERLLAGLLVAARLWADGHAFDEDKVRTARAAVLLDHHQRYVRLIPAYRRLAVDLDLVVVDDVDTLVENLLVGVAWFKSYDDQLLDRADFTGLTRWLAQVSTLRPEPDLHGVRDIEDWRRRLRRVGAYVTVSSGTTGQPSFVVRDAATLGALRANGRWYSTLGWSGGEDFDCLLATEAGTALGIQAVTTGLARSAAHAHWLHASPAASLDDAYTAAVDFITATRAKGRRLIVFGSPPQVSALCRTLLNKDAAMTLPPGSLLVTGGGWKTTDGQDDAAASLGGLVTDAFGLAPEQTVDIYGLAECNAYLIRCAAGRYHVPPVIEAVVVDERLVPLRKDDAIGELGLLDPFAFSYPGFILTGDVGRLVQTPCACGVTGPGFVGPIARSTGSAPKGCAAAAPGVLA